MSPPRFVGQSLPVRLLPWMLVLVGLCTAASGGFRAVIGAVVLALGVFAKMAVPWRFVVVDEGIALFFGFRKRRFLPRDQVTVHVDLAGVRVLPDAEHFAYPLADGISNRRAAILKAVLEEHGYRVVGS